MPELEKIIPHPKDLKTLCVKHLVLNDAKDLMHSLEGFEKKINSFGNTNDIPHAMQSADDFLDAWTDWKRQQAKKHPKFVASFEKDILTKVNDAKKELEARKKDDLPGNIGKLYDTCKEIMLDTHNVGSTVTVGRLPPLAASITKRSANAVKSIKFIQEHTKGDQKIAALMDGVVNELRGILLATKTLDAKAKAVDPTTKLEKDSHDTNIKELLAMQDRVYESGKGIVEAARQVQKKFS